jgi:hypothetical protein
MKLQQLFVLLALAIPTGLWAQAASPYIPLDHWAMPYIEHLIRSGVIDDPNPLTRPLRVTAVTEALARVDHTKVAPASRTVIQDLLDEFADQVDGARGEIDLLFEGSVRSHARHDPVRPAGEGGGKYRGGFHARLVAGPLTFSTRPLLDSNLDQDPDYGGIRHGPFIGRIQDAYISVETGPLEVVFGNVARNWGPPALHGMLLSNVPYGYDHLLVSLDTRFFGIQTLVTQLDDMVVEGAAHQRYWVAHRAVFRPWSRLSLWFNQATLLAGPGRNLDVWALNPLRFNQIAAEDEDTERGTNSFLEMAARIGLARRLTLTAVVMIDDLSLFGRDAGVDAPERGGVAFTLDGGISKVSWELLYTAISSLAYRTFGASEVALRRGVGIGRNFSDYDQVTAFVTTMAPLNTLLGFEVTHLRQGEGDIRKPFPTGTELAGAPMLFRGTVERTWRVAASLETHPVAGLAIRGTAGYHRVFNAGNIEGEQSSDFVGGISVSYSFRFRFSAN